MDDVEKGIIFMTLPGLDQPVASRYPGPVLIL
jgi:hypothetical protein